MRLDENTATVVGAVGSKKVNFVLDLPVVSPSAGSEKPITPTEHQQKSWKASAQCNITKQRQHGTVFCDRCLHSTPVSKVF